MPPTPDWRVLEFTRHLDPAPLQQLAELASLAQWPAGETVFRAGDQDSPLYLVDQGRVAIEMPLPGRGMVTALTVEPGEIFGWSSLFHRRPKTANARALLATTAFAWDSAKLRELCDADPAFGYALSRRILEVVSERLKATRIQLLDVFKV